jgi:hypothetical protein
METFAHEQPPAQSFLDYEGPIKQKEPGYDAETQAIVDEFKRPAY